MKSLKNIIFTMAAFLLFGCYKDLLTTIPNDRISSDIFWQTESDATLAANGVYLFMDDVWKYVHWDALSDIGHVTLQWRGESMIEKGDLNAGYAQDVIRSHWNDGFAGIQAANIFLDNVDKVESSNTQLIDRLKGEVKTLRAMFYIRLASLFGDVPLLTKETTLEESKNLTRTPVSQIWDFISTELTDAAQKLPLNQDEVGRVTRGAALALKARAMLYAGRYQDAAVAAKAVMDLGVYDLYPSYEKLFTYEAENCTEVIFDRQYMTNNLPNNIFQLTTPNSIWPQINSFVPTKFAVDAYEMINGKSIYESDSGFDLKDPYSNRDPRLHYTIYTVGDILLNGKIYDSRPNSGTADALGYSENTTATGFNVKKYLNIEDLSNPSNCGINLIMVRYAEILLTYAEAKIEANQIDDSVLDAINKIRKRPDVNMPEIKGVISQSALRDIVRNERLVELAFEGLRYFDIRRWKIAETIVPGIIYGMTYFDEDGYQKTVELPGFMKTFNKDRDYLWPIPYREIELNPNLVQNPNW
ncbi:MAG: RagB/SusD family nutrient uptake outer membrane protein [Tannerella sp.]|jgi:hypothetical protein|nr:RagB/SusD family nutrient uptake outer membrane protein [Tannerella sp.]